jgi:MazG family protein
MDDVIRTCRGDFGYDAESLLRILRILRAPGGCPWDREQTRHTLTRSLTGECAEVVDAIDREDVDGIREELGDLLMNVLFQVVIAEEKNEFAMADVWKGINEKMVRRHAHIFGDAHADTPEEVARLWAEIKEKEHSGEVAPASLLDKVPQSLSALTRSHELQKKAAKVGFDWPDASGAAAKVGEEARELAEALRSGDDAHVDEELGDLIFAAVNLARLRKRGTAEELTRAAARKFETRFREVEKQVAASGRAWEDLTLAELDAFWNEAKRRESAAAEK